MPSISLASMLDMQLAKEIIQQLDLSPHPEGGYYRRVHQTPDNAGSRGLMTAIYYLLEGGDFARWHKVDADELWFWHAGAPLVLETCPGGPDSEVHEHILGTDLISGEQPQACVPAHRWQRAKSLGDYTLVSCSVSPGFLFDTYELAEEGFDPTSL